MDNKRRRWVLALVLTLAAFLMIGGVIAEVSIDVVFNVQGVGADYAGIVLELDGVSYDVSDLPVSLSWVVDSSHSFAFMSPLSVDSLRGYGWNNTVGATSARAGTLSLGVSSSVTGIYVGYDDTPETAEVVFDQTGVGEDYSGIVLTVDGVDYIREDLPKAFSWVVGSSHSYSYSTPLDVDDLRWYYWNSTTGLATLREGSVAVPDAGGLVNAVYLLHQEAPPVEYVDFVFNQTGIGSDYSGIVMRVDSTYLSVGDLPYSVTWIKDSTHSFEYLSPLEIGDVSKYVWSSTNGYSELRNATIIVNESGVITGNYDVYVPPTEEIVVTFRQVGVGSDYVLVLLKVDGANYRLYDFPLSFVWDEGSVHSYEFITTLSVTSEKIYVLQGVSGLVSTKVGSITVSTSGEVIATYDEEIIPPQDNVQIVFDVSGLDGDYTGIIITIDDVDYNIASLPASFMWLIDSTHSFTFHTPLETENWRYSWVSTSGLSSVRTGSITVSAAGSVTGNYVAEEIPDEFVEITFNQNGVGLDFDEVVVVVNGVGIKRSQLPFTVSWAWNTSLSYVYLSPLAGAEYQYSWVSTSGLATGQSGTIVALVPGSITGYYSATEIPELVQVTFDQTGIDPSYNKTVVIIGDIGYTVNDLPVTFNWIVGINYTYAYLTPLIVDDEVGYRWISTEGLVSSISGILTASVSGTITGNYEQYAPVDYVNVIFNQTGVGEYAGTVLIVNGISYNKTQLPITFKWAVGTANNYAFLSPFTISEGVSNVWSSTSGLSNLQSGTIIASVSGEIVGNYKTLYTITFNQTGVDSGYEGIILSVDGETYIAADLPAEFNWVKGSIHNFSYLSPLPINEIYSYIWNSTTGLVSTQSGEITANIPGSVIGNYNVEINPGVKMIHGVKYNDLSVNGLHDAGEPALQGWVIELRSSNGTLLKSTSTDENGYYMFYVVPGTYSVNEVMQNGWINISSESVTVTVTTSDIAVNFGNVMLTNVYTVSGVVFDDTNLNGIKDDGETGVGGVLVSISTGISVYTISNGQYTLYAPAGNHTISIDVDLPWICTTENPVMIDTNDYPSMQISVDFGVYEIPENKSIIRIHKFNDTDVDGIHDVGEASLPGWVISVNDGEVSFDVTTGVTGYAYASVDSDELYLVSENMQNGWYPTTSPIVYVFADEAVVYVEFANTLVPEEESVVNGFKFNDMNSNGDLDFGEELLSGWVFTVSYGATSYDVTTVNGYFVTLVPTGIVVRVVENQQSGWRSTTPDLIQIQVTSQPNVYTVIFGNTNNPNTAAIYGIKFNDLNGNGVQDPNEPGIAGWVINLVKDNVTIQTTTKAYGQYTYGLTVTEPGYYTVSEEMHSGWYPTTPQSVIVLVELGHSYHVDFGNKQISPDYGVVICQKIDVTHYDQTHEMIPLSGWTIQVWQNGAKITESVTSQHGYAYFELLPGDYEFKEVMQSGWYAVTSPNVPLSIGADEFKSITFANSFIHTDYGVIQGCKFENVGYYHGLEGWTIQVWNGTQLVASKVTGAHGWYSVQVPVGTYTVKEVIKAGWVPVTSPELTRTVTDGGFADATFINEEVEPEKSAIYGFKFHDVDGDGVWDTDEPALEGWTINISGAASKSTITDENGYYVFTDLEPGIFTLSEEDRAGWTNTVVPPQVNAVAGQAYGPNNFGNFEWATVSGYKLNAANGEGLSGWTIKLSDSTGVINSTVTDVNGYYAMPIKWPGDYNVTEELQTHWTQIAAPSEFTAHNGESITEMNFTNSLNYYLVTFNQSGSEVAPEVSYSFNSTSSSGYAPFSILVPGGYELSFSYESIVSGSEGVRYVFKGASIVSPFTVNGPLTITGSYERQVKINFEQVGLGTDIVGDIVTVNGDGKTSLPYSLWVNSTQSTTYEYSEIVNSTINRKRYVLTNVSGPSSPIITSVPVTVVGNYTGEGGIQYLVNFNASGYSDAVGTIVTVEGVPVDISGLSYSIWVNSGSNVTFSYEEYVSNAADDTRYLLMSVDASSPLLVDGPKTVTAVYGGNEGTEYKVTFDQYGLPSDATSIVANVNGTDIYPSDMPYILWIKKGESVSYCYETYVYSSLPGVRYPLLNVTGSASPITVDAPSNVTGYYDSEEEVEYKIIFNATGLPEQAVGLVVTVDGTTVNKSGLPYSIWATSGSTVEYLYETYVYDETGFVRYVLKNVTGPASGFTVTQPENIVGNYGGEEEAEYLVTFTQSGSAVPPTVTYTVDAEPPVSASVPVSVWVKNGEEISYTYEAIVSGATGVRYSFAGATPASPQTITSALNVTGYYNTQYYLTVTSAYDSPSGEGWYDSGTNAYASLTSLVVPDGTGKQYAFTHWSGDASGTTSPSNAILMDSPKTAVANWATQYYLTLVTPYGTASGGGWYNEGQTAYFSVAPTVVVNSTVQAIFQNWTSTDNGGYTGALASSSVVMNNPITETAYWKIQYNVTFTQMGLDTDAKGTVVTINGANYTLSDLPHTIWADQGSITTYQYMEYVLTKDADKRYHLQGVTGPSSPITVSGPATITGDYSGVYSIEYRLIVRIEPASLNMTNISIYPIGMYEVTSQGWAGWWYPNGTQVTITAATTAIGANGETYYFSHWKIDASGSENPLIVILNTKLMIQAAYTSKTPI